MILRTNIILSIVFTLVLSACSNNPPPFKAKYISSDDVLVTFKDKQYHLNRFRQNDQVPFGYAFEPDGDLDLFIDGKEYEIDSPFDVDKKKKTGKTVKKKKEAKKQKKK